jgi:hypothetical protein
MYTFLLCTYSSIVSGLTLILMLSTVSALQEDENDDVDDDIQAVKKL